MLACFVHDRGDSMLLRGDSMLCSRPRLPPTTCGQGSSTGATLSGRTRPEASVSVLPRFPLGTPKPPAESVDERFPVLPRRRRTVAPLFSLRCCGQGCSTGATPTARSVAKSTPNINFLIKQLLQQFRIRCFQGEGGWGGDGGWGWSGW